MHDTVSGWLAAWVRSARSGVRRRHASCPARTRVATVALAWLWPGRRWLLAREAAAAACATGRCYRRPRHAVALRLILCGVVAAAGAIASPSCPCLTLHLCAAVGPVRCCLCRAQMAGLVVALSLMALRRVDHAGHERTRLSASA